MDLILICILCNRRTTLVDVFIVRGNNTRNCVKKMLDIKCVCLFAFFYKQ